MFLIIGISVYISKTSTSEDFLIGGRDRNGLAILFSKFAGAIGVSTLITYTGYAYTFGWGLFAMSIGSVVGYLLFAFWAAPKIKKLSLKGQFYTQGDLPKFVTNTKNTAVFTNLITIVVQFFWIVLSLAGGAKIIAFFDILSYEMALLITTGVVLTYVLVSGYKAVIITDIIQALIIIVFLIIIVYGVLDIPDLGNVIHNSTPRKVSIGSVLGLTLYGGLSVFGMADRYQLCYSAKDEKSLKFGMGMADRYQLCYSAKDEKSLKFGMGMAIIPVLFIAFILLLIGLYVYQQNASLDADTVFVYAMKHFLNTSWLPLLLVLFFAGLMSSADTSIFAVASHSLFNVKEKNKIKSLRYATISTVVGAFVLAYFWRNIVEITIVGAALRMTLSIAMIYVIKGNKNSGRFTASAIGGVAGLLAFGPKPTIAITVLIGSLLGLIYKSKKHNTK